MSSCLALPAGPSRLGDDAESILRASAAGSLCRSTPWAASAERFRCGSEADIVFAPVGDSVLEDQTIPPGGTLHTRLSLRFGPAGATNEQLAADLYEAYIRRNPVTQKWTDNRLGHREDVDPVDNISEKIAYAQKRWGCTIFYLDTPGLYWMRDGKPSYFQIPPHVLRKVMERHPDILLFPEFADTGIFALGSRYGELASRNRTRDAIRAIYPGAFTSYAIKDHPIYTDWDEIVTGAMNGDILIFRGWMQGKDAVRAGQVWQEAHYRKQATAAAVAAAGDDSNKLIKLLSAPDPVVRFQAITKIGSIKSTGAAGPLTQVMTGDAEWVNRRAAAAALGEIGGGEAITALGAELVRHDSSIQWFVGLALGKAGPAAHPALTSALGSSDRSIWEAIAAGLARMKDPRRAELMRAILADREPNAAAAQIIVLDALGNVPDPVLVDAIIPLLGPGKSFVQGALNAKAATALGIAGNSGAIPPLLELLDRQDPGLDKAKKAAAKSLEKITGRSGSDPTVVSGGENANKWRELLDIKK